MSTTMRPARFEIEPLTLVALLACGLMYPLYRGIGAVAVGVAVILLIAWRSRWMSLDRGRGLVTTAGVAIGLSLLVFRVTLRMLPSFEWEVPQPIWGEIGYVGAVGAVGVAILAARGNRSTSEAPRWFGWLISVALMAALTLLCANVVLHSKPLVDVIIGHEAAAEVLVDGLDPYSDLEFPDTSPLAEPGDVISGYVYPPSALAAYGGSYLLTGDSRWVTILAFAAFVLLIVRPWHRQSWGVVLTVSAAAMMFTALPYLDLVTYIGWTDPIALPFLIVAIRHWADRPVVSAVMLGLALSTKQYFVVAAPLLLLLSDTFRWKRVLIAGATVLATYAPFLAMGTGVLLAPLEQLGGQAYRPDSLGLANLKVNVPRPVSMLAGFTVAAFVGLRGGSAARIALGLSGALAALFVTGSQSFINYWVVVAGLLVVVLVARSERGVDDDVPPAMTDDAETERDSADSTR